MGVPSPDTLWREVYNRAPPVHYSQLRISIVGVMNCLMHFMSFHVSSESHKICERGDAYI